MLLNERMTERITLARSNRESLAVMVADIDKLKNINDTFGQTIGDELLVEVAKRIQSLGREDDTVARVGDDTFVIVLAGAKTTQATRTAQRLLDLLSTPLRIRELELAVTPTIGIALFPAHGTDCDTLIKCAHTALHRAKHGGRNHYMFYTQEMQIRSGRNLVLEIALRHAIERGELQLHYQPQISLLDGRITGAEALLRWRNPDLGIVSPAEFIPITEDSGQILQIGTWVLRTAITQLRDWLTAGITPFSLAVNISSTQFRHPNLPGLIGKILQENQLEARHLELELTERVAMDDPLAAIAIMNELHDLGVRLIERETLDSALMSARSVLEQLGWERHQARTLALRFRRHNIEQLFRMAPHRKDEAKWIAAAKQGRQQLEELFAQERDEAAARHRRAGWVDDDEPPRRAAD